MSSTTYYALALPLITIGAGSAYLNYKIQKAWFKDYKRNKESNE